MNYADIVKFENTVQAADGKADKKVLLDTPSLKVLAIALGTDGILEEHSAPGDALITVLKGEAVITYGAEDYRLEEGDFFRMEKGVLHSLKAEKPFEMTVTISL